MKCILKKILILGVLLTFSSISDAAIDGSNILITEIMSDAVQSGVDSEFEWIELYNPTNTTIDINGWEIVDGAGNSYIFNSATDNTVINSGEYRLLVLDSFDTPPNGKTDTNNKSFEIGYPGLLGGLPSNSDFIDLVEAIKLNNTGDAVELCSGPCSGLNQVDYFEWEDFSNTGLWNSDAGNGTGNAICRDGIIDTDTESDWSVTACNTDPTDTINDGSPGTGTYGIYGVTITETDDSTAIMENGLTTDTYTLVLESTPSATETVTVAIAPDAQCSVDLISVSFDNTDWDIPKTITVTAIDDDLVETTPHTCAIVHTTTSSNTISGYHRLATDGVLVDVDDNDVVTSSSPSSRRGGSRRAYVCKDKDALNYSRFGSHRQSKCQYEEENINLDTKTTPFINNRQCPYFSSYHKLGDRNTGDIALIQKFLNEFYQESLDVDGQYGPMTSAAVSRFQSRWFDEILSPWGLTSPTGEWYQSTRNKANEVAGCDEGDVVLDNGALVN